MSDLVLVVGEFAGEPCAFTLEQLEEARERAKGLLPCSGTRASEKPAERLYTAQELEEATSVPASWWEQAAREGRVTCFRFGKYPRFRWEDALEAARGERRK